MLPKKHRLPLRTEFRRVKKEGQFIQDCLFGLLVAPGTGKESRFAFIVSRKISKKAVERNRIKRLLAEAVQSFLPQVKPGLDFLFLAKKTILGQPLATVKKEIEKNITRSH